MKLNLANPIVFFDLETTGINIAKDRIVEISVLKVYPNGKEEQKTIRVNPGMHIPEEASAIHGIYDEDVKDAPMFKHIARELAHYIEGCDLGGYNSNRFDIPLLAEEFLRAEVDFDMSKREVCRCTNYFPQNGTAYPGRLPTIFIVINVLKMPIRLQPTRWLPMRC